MSRVALALGLTVMGCSTSADAPAKAGSAVAPGPAPKDPARARQMIANGAVVFDVRTPEEFAEGHLDHAINIPVEELAGRMSDVAKVARKDQPIVAYCASGYRAGNAQRALQSAGYAQVVNGGGLGDVRPTP